MENGVGFQRQLVPGNVCRPEPDRRGDIGPRHRDGLSGQCVHEVEIDVVETGSSRGVDAAPDVAAPVDAGDGLQAPVVETLRADRQPVDARGAIAGR